MGIASYHPVSYWQWMFDHDLTLMVAHDRLWRFRRRAGNAPDVLDARLEEDGLVITRRLFDDHEEIVVRIDDHDLELCGLLEGREICHHLVALPAGVPFDEARITTAPNGSVVEVHVPLAQRPSTMQPAGVTVAA